MVRSLAMLAIAGAFPGEGDALRGPCANIAEIKIVSPPSPQAIDDPAYGQLRLAAYDALPCLIDRIVDQRTMDAPANFTGKGWPTVGEVAFRVAEDIVGPALHEALADIALDDSFSTVEGRTALRNRLRAWLENENQKDGSAPPLSVTERARVACGRLAALRYMPLREEAVSDPVYNQLVALGDEALPCLIDRVLDRRSMPDPRSIPSGRTTIGDVAFFLISRVSARLDPWEVAVPLDVKRSVENEGYYVFLEYSSQLVNRREIHRRLRDWYVRSLDTGTRTVH